MMIKVSQNIILSNDNWNNSFALSPLVLSDPPTRVTLQLTSVWVTGATVSEGDTVAFACSGSGGQPTPTVTVVSKDSSVQLATGLSPLNHEENNVRCEDDGVYTCSADNRMGQSATTTATLYVNCEYSERRELTDQ